MTEKIFKLFFDEEIILENDEILEVEEDENNIKTKKVYSVYKLFKVIVVFLFVCYLYKIGMDLIFPFEPLKYEFIHNTLFGLTLIIFLSFLMDYYYIKEMCKISIQNINRKLINKIKCIFVSTVIISVLGLHNICYGIVCVIVEKNYIYYLFVISIFLIIIFSLILIFNLINSIFKPIDKIKKEMDGII